MPSSLSSSNYLVLLALVSMLAPLSGCLKKQDHDTEAARIAVDERICIGNLLDDTPSNGLFQVGSSREEVYAILGEPAYIVETDDNGIVLYYMWPLDTGLKGEAIRTNGIAISTQNGVVKKWSPILEAVMP